MLLTMGLKNLMLHAMHKSKYARLGMLGKLDGEAEKVALAVYYRLYKRDTFSTCFFMFKLTESARQILRGKMFCIFGGVGLKRRFPKGFCSHLGRS